MWEWESKLTRSRQMHFQSLPSSARGELLQLLLLLLLLLYGDARVSIYVVCFSVCVSVDVARQGKHFWQGAAICRFRSCC